MKISLMNTASTLMLSAMIAVLNSCYEDKGNYSYTDIGAVEVEVGQDQAFQRIMMGKNLQITPSYTLDKIDKENLTFTWDIVNSGATDPEYKVLSNEEVLDVPIVEVPGSYSVRLGICNTLTDVTYYGYYQIEVTTALSRAFLLLCDVGNNRYDIEAAPDFPTIGTVVHKLYSSINGDYLKDARKLVYRNNFLWYQDFLWVLQEDGGQSLSPVNLTYHGDASEWFFEAPATIRPLEILGDVMGMTYYMVVNGQLYYINNLKRPFKAGMPVLTRDGSEYEITGVATVMNMSQYEDYVFWDNKGKRFLHWQARAKVLETMTGKEGTFDPNAVGDMTPCFMGDGVRDYSLNIMKDAAGKFHLFEFKNESKGYNSVLAAPYRHIVLEDRFEFDKATAVCPSRKLNVLYYAVENKIYLYDPMLNERRLIHEFADKNLRFVELYSKSGYDNRLLAAANSGDTGYFYRIYLNMAGDLQAPTEGMKQPWDEVGPYPRIVDMEYKYKAY